MKILGRATARLFGKATVEDKKSKTTLKDQKSEAVVKDEKSEIERKIIEVNEAHKILQKKVEALVREANGNRVIVYDTSLCDDRIVEINQNVSDLFSDAKLFSDRWKLSEYCAEMLTFSASEHLRQGSSGKIDCIVEVGVETGVYSSFLADLFQPNEIVLIDLKFTSFKKENNRESMRRLEGRSADMLPTLDPKSIDYVYVDASHSYHDTMEEIERVLPKMKQGGIIQFNDYATFNLRFAQPYGVKAAVNQLINSRRVSIVGHGLCPLGFDDIAVRVL